MTAVGAVLAFFITILFLFALRPVASALGLIDHPGGRKRHGGPVPVIGGISMAIGLAFGSNLIAHPDFWNPTILAIYLLVMVGTIDDRFDLPAVVRLIAQTCASLLVVFGAELSIAHLGTPLFFESPLGVAAPMFSILFIITIINAFNVIDGIDGLAGSLALIALASLAVIGSGADAFGLTVLLLSVVFAYLLFNFPLAFNRRVRTFMGDTGSTVLGLGIACIGISLTQGAEPRMSASVGLWFVAVPVFDLFSAIMRRVFAGRSPFAPDHEHLHHVLVVNGLSPHATLGFLLALAIACAAFGLVGHAAGWPDGVMCLSWIAACVVFYQAMRRPAVVVRGVQAVQRALRADDGSATEAD